MNIDKVVRLGRGQYGNVYCKIQFSNGKLSITGVEGPKSNGDAIGSCGQIVAHLAADVTDYAPGWDADSVAKFAATWARWHLNDMRAGSPAQEAYLLANPISYEYPESYYDKACAALALAGLNPDNGYKYGTKWLREDVPVDVIEYLAALPDTDTNPAWV